MAEGIVIDVGECGGRRVLLDGKKHVVILGVTGGGKSTLLLNAFLQLVAQGMGVSLSDLDNDTAAEADRKVVEMMDSLPPLRRRQIISLRPGVDVAYYCDPFETDVTGVAYDFWLAARVELVVQVMSRPQFIEDLKEFRRLSRILENVCYLCGTNVNGKHLGLHKALDMAEFAGPFWDRVFEKVRSHLPIEIAQDCARIRQLPPTLKIRETESCINLLRRFLHGPLMKQILKPRG